MIQRSSPAILIEGEAGLGDFPLEFDPSSTEPESEREAEEVGGWRGEVQQLSLLDLLQMYHYGRRSVTVELDGETGGHLVLQGGEVVHAAASDLRGLPALARLLAATGGYLRTRPLPRKVRASIAGEFETVILEALRQIDEANRGETVDSDPSTFEHDLEDAFSEFAPSTGNELHANLRGVLASLAQLEGLRGACVVDASNSRLLAEWGEATTVEGEAGSKEALCLRSRLPLLNGLGLGDTVEDVVITAGSFHHLVRPVGNPTGGIYLYVVLTKGYSNLALARFLLASAVRDLAAVLT